MSIRRKHMKAQRAFSPFRFLLPQLSSAWRSSCVEWTGDGGGSKWKIAVLSGYYFYIYVYVCTCSVMSDSATSWTAAHETPVSMGFPRQEYWSGLPFPSPGESSQPRDQTHVSCVSFIGRLWQILYHWTTTWEIHLSCLKDPFSMKGFLCKRIVFKTTLERTRNIWKHFLPETVILWLRSHHPIFPVAWTTLFCPHPL